MEVKATLKYTRVGAQKARLVADLVRGKDVSEALKTLKFLDKKSSTLITKLIKSAVANAEQKKVIDLDNLYVKTIYVDAGPVLKRFTPRAQGRATEIRKKTSHITLLLDER
jgi:large subunit ribosomal protein L22